MEECDGHVQKMHYVGISYVLQYFIGASGHGILILQVSIIVIYKIK